MERGMKMVPIDGSPFKGTVAWDFWEFFLHQTVPPGLARGYLELNFIFIGFPWVIKVIPVNDYPAFRTPGSQLEVRKIEPNVFV